MHSDVIFCNNILIDLQAWFEQSRNYIGQCIESVNTIAGKMTEDFFLYLCLSLSLQFNLFLFIFFLHMTIMIISII